MVRNVLVPLARCEHGPDGKLPPIRPPHTDRRVEDHADRLSIAWFGSPEADARNLRVSHLEAPAGSATGLYRGQTDGSRGRHDPEVPRRRPGRRGTERGGEGAITHARRPALRVVALGEALECRLVGDHAGGTLENEVEPGKRDRDDAVRVLHQVAALARSGATDEVDLAVGPHRADSRAVRPPVGPRRAQPPRLMAGRLPLFRRFRLEGLERARPGNDWVAVDVEILLLHFRASYRHAEFQDGRL